MADAAMSANESNPRYTERHRQIAVHHATILQQRKDFENKILQNLEELIDYPLAACADPQNPSSEDAARCSTLVAFFQLSDYDSLIEERNAVDKCGYMLCPSSRSKRRGSGIHSVILSGARGRDLQVVSSDKAYMFCNNACVKRAMFIKVQLSEVPAWERAGGLGNRIEIMREDVENELERRMKGVNLQDNEEAKMQKAMEELALERGETRMSALPKFVLKDQIVEKGDPT